MSEFIHEFTISIEQAAGYEFRVKFDKPHHAELTVDEPAPLGKDVAPNPARILAAAIGSCLTASLLFCLGKKRIPVAGMRAEVKVPIVRNQDRRLRIGRVEVLIEPQIAPEDRDKARACLDLFEDFCTVTQSVRQGLDVGVSVKGLEPTPPPTG